MFIRVNPWSIISPSDSNRELKVEKISTGLRLRDHFHGSRGSIVDNFRTERGIGNFGDVIGHQFLESLGIAPLLHIEQLNGLVEIRHVNSLVRNLLRLAQRLHVTAETVGGRAGLRTGTGLAAAGQQYDRRNRRQSGIENVHASKLRHAADKSKLKSPVCSLCQEQITRNFR